MMNIVPVNWTNCIPTVKSEHYMKVYTTPFTCHPLDGNYYTYLLTDGSYFSYRVVAVPYEHSVSPADCESSGGTLIKINTEARLNFLHTLLSTCPEFSVAAEFYMIGGYKDPVDGTWRWADGEPISPIFWANGKPDGLVGEDCLLMDYRFNWRFNDAQCQTYYEKQLYICGKEVP